MSSYGEVLIAILNNRADLEIARNHHWYRVPVDQVAKLKQREYWQPKWLAFYQTKVFGAEAHTVRYYAEVTAICEVHRWELFPEEAHNVKSEKRYCKLELSPLRQLSKPIMSKRLRRITFIPTTWEKFAIADEINDLWNDSPLEDQLWKEFKKLEIDAERQEHIKVKERNYFLDFAIYCVDGKINVETDGDTYHTQKEQVVQDNIRENALKTTGWRTLRFNSHQLKEQMADYCIPTIVENINRLGGLSEQGLILHSVQPVQVVQQLNLFDRSHSCE